MRRDFNAYLLDMYRAGHNIDLFTLGFDWDMYQSVLVVQKAVEREFEVLGEAMRQCSCIIPLNSALLGMCRA